MKSLKILLSVTLTSLLISGCFSGKNWSFANRQSAGIAPDPAITKEAVIHVYGANTWGWRGLFAIHTWIATKYSNQKNYTVYDVVGWRTYQGNPVMNIKTDIPDRFWFGEKPRLIKEHRGEGVDEMIDAVNKAAEIYPWKTTYKAFPGPNSNTFTAWISKQVPELKITLPFSAIGSGYIK